jgi:hypothetical protein
MYSDQPGENKKVLKRKRQETSIPRKVQMGKNKNRNQSKGTAVPHLI